MGKFKLAVVGLAFTGIVSLGLNSFIESQQAGEADLPAPARPDYVNIGDGGAPAYNGGDTPAPAYNKGDGGGAPSNLYGDYPAPQEI
ncbi:Phr family secreted Rap phosphatase inhibitor [Bacillus bingmayongensis]|uniref:Phr family secreted Rap phosphatase inhibitor n=1 Tax=Bacillus bingmayongensis TaxID=1150157 RepID=UPI0002E52AF1|nr:Phr family secreted Rap phosphatase inhibitor [Bacillus bingmayongensis]MBY0595888.1 Phr family secreted Rap phosphatase inhibitor [Bacillus bingmayongensis]